MDENFVMNYRNHRYNAEGTVDCEIEHPAYGWIPFTASPSDVEQLGVYIYANAIKRNPSPYVVPTPKPKPVPQALPFAQLLIGLVTEGWITAEEGRAWRNRTALPPAVAGLIASLPEVERFAAETRALILSEVFRLDPLVLTLGAAQGKTSEELDTFFATYAAA